MAEKKEIKDVKVKDCMSRSLQGVSSETNILVVSQIMAQRDIGSILVKSGDDFLGIITEKDIIRKVVAKSLDPKTVIAETLMSYPISTIDQEQSLVEAHQLMAEQNIRHIMVTENEKPVGMISVRTWLESAGD